jgi:succinate dehydrogenase / fumarate reductase cytochrome b subunit
MRRELSPHLTIYSTQISSGLSIFHRMTGTILAGCILLMIPAILAYTFFGNDIMIASEFFYPILFVIMGAVSYHAANGIRHFIWDTGAYVSTEGVKTTAILLSVLAFIFFVALLFVIL